MADGARRPPESVNATAVVLQLSWGLAPSPSNIEWPKVLEVAARERCAALTWHRSGDIIRRLAPREIVATWRALALRARARGEHLLDALNSAIEALRCADVRPIVLKGFPLSARLYGDPFVRDSVDIDLWVAGRDRGRARESLCRTGWTWASGAPPWEELFVSELRPGTVFLELHSHLLADELSHFSLPTPTAAEWPIHGVHLPAHVGATLPMVLAAHLAQHHLPPLLWDLDFATLWEQMVMAERDSAQRAASEAGLSAYLRRSLRRTVSLQAARSGDLTALQGLGYGERTRKELHPLWRHIRCAPTAVSAYRTVGGILWPPAERGSTVSRMLLGTLRRVRANGVGLLYRSRVA